MTEDTYTAGLEELRKLKGRIAELEALAAEGPRPGLGDAIGDHFSPTRAPTDPARRKLESRARGFLADPSMEDALRQRTAMGAAPYAAEMQRVGASNGLAMALYESSRTAAIAVGAWTPDTTEGDAA